MEDRHLVKEWELKVARRDGEDRRRPANVPPGEACIDRVLKAYKIRVFRAPAGMKRNVENTTSWSKRQRDIHWQVEWIRGGEPGRLLEKALGFKTLGKAYAEVHELARRANLTEEGVRMEKKRKAEQIKERHTKRVKLEHERELDMTSMPRLQNTRTSAWDSLWHDTTVFWQDELPSWIMDVQFYLHRPNTPSKYPKVLIPLDSTKPLLDQLRNQELLEFPTIYIQEKGALPEHSMLEKDYLKATGQQVVSPADDSSSSEEEDDDTSTSGSDTSDQDEDSDVEEGEIR